MKYLFVSVFCLVCVSFPVSAAFAGSGDVSGDGLLTGTDLDQLNAYLLGKTDLSDSQKSNADINSDTRVNVADSVLMINRFVTQITIDVTPTSGSWVLTGPPGFTALNGSGDRLGSDAIKKPPLGVYYLHSKPLKGYVDPADLICTLTLGSTVAFMPAYSLPGAMISVPAGTFMMGSEGEDMTAYPAHLVTLKAYEIGKYEVTNGRFCEVMNWARTRGYLRDSSGNVYTGTGDTYTSSGQRIAYVYQQTGLKYIGDNFFPMLRMSRVTGTCSMEMHPVTSVTWHGAVAFCNWLSEMEGLTPCYDPATSALKAPCPNGYRLPSESEWERAAAWDGNKKWKYAITRDDIDITRANYWGWTTANPVKLVDEPLTSPVGWFNGSVHDDYNYLTNNSPSPAGCYDMNGNVFEWCQDWCCFGYANAPTDGSAYDVPTVPFLWHVYRGGSYADFDQFLLTSARPFGANPDTIGKKIGFRLARTP